MSVFIRILGRNAKILMKKEESFIFTIPALRAGIVNNLYPRLRVKDSNPDRLVQSQLSFR